MRVLFTFLQIYFFRKGPEDVPYSLGLMVFLLFIGATIRVLLLNLAHIPYAWILVCIDYAFLALFISLTLHVRKLPMRFVQTFCATLGVELVELSLVGIINLLALNNAVLVYTLIQFWGWAVLSSIMRQALNIKVMSSVLLTFTYQLIVVGFYWLVWVHL